MYQNLLAPIDGSDEAHQAAEHALDLAAELDATVHVLYVIEPRPAFAAKESSEQQDEQIPEEHRAYAQEQVGEVADLAASKDVECEREITSGFPGSEIVESAEDSAVDAIVMGTRGHGWGGVDTTVLGSTTQRVNRTASIPVLTVR